MTEVRPDIVILDTDLASGNSFDLCRAIKDDRALRSTRVILAFASPASQDDLERVANSGCDDILALPVQTDEFYQHIAQLAGLPVRRKHRVGVTLELILPTRDDCIMGKVFNVSTQGIGCQVGAPLAKGMSILFRLGHDNQVTPDTRATVSWVEHVHDHDVIAGLELTDDIPVKTRVLLENLALYDVTRAADDSPMAGGVAVALQGDFNELTKFHALAERLADETAIDFNTSAIRYLSSAGVRSWCGFLETLAPKRYVFRHCSMAFTSQASLVPMMIGHGEVLSMEAPYICESCDREEMRLIETRAIARTGRSIIPPRFTCHDCGDPLEFDDLPARYFAFLLGDA